MSPTSTMSLHDELSHSMNSLDMIPEATSPRQSKQTSPQPTEDMSADLVVNFEPELDFYCSPTSTLRRASMRSLQSGLSTLRRVDHQELMAAWSTSSDDDRDSPCPRCKNMQEMVTNYQQELSLVNKQLLSAVEQKIKLQEQNEAWQSDMAEIVHQNLYQRLEQDSPARKEKLSKSPKRKMFTSNKDDAEKIFKHEFIKHSWLF
ncbi:BICD family-like cargo adapter 1 [Halichondria panicea]|uniref:BICD family-like cargo adapter 1 n=3 Tax=Halichondria panicea TaxID=6063 RepID=UPI00312BBF7C